MEGIKQNAMATKAHRRYHHLLALLFGQGLLRLPPDLAGFRFPTPRRGLIRCLEEVEVPVEPGEWEIAMFYVQPTAPEMGIGFEQLAGIVDQHDDPLGRAFAASLRRWVTPAGSPRP